MINKSYTGGSFSYRAWYMEEKEPDRVDWKDTHNLAADEKAFYVSQMEDTASLSKAKEPVYHVMVSYAPEDNPTQKMMKEDAAQLLEDLELDGHQAVVVAHNDKDYKHMHLMINRVDHRTGRAWNTWQDRPKIRSSLRGIEKERGYRQVPRVKGRSISQQAYHRTKDAEKFADIPLETKKDLLREDLGKTQNWKQFTDTAAEYGTQLRKKGRGAVLEDIETGEQMKLSSVSRQMSFGKLEKKFGKFEDFQKNLELTDKLKDNFQHKPKFGEKLTDLHKSLMAGDKDNQRKSKAGLQKVLNGAVNVRRTQKTIKNLGMLISANPQAAALKVGKKMAQKAVKQLQQQNQMER